jgi:hypothetical protein
MRTLKAGIVYFLVLFAIGWILGPIRERWAVPRVGRTAAVLLEAVIMSIAMTVSAWWVMRRFDVSLALGSTISMGLVALGILLPAELAGVLWVRRLPLRNYLSSFTNAAGVISLLMFLLFPAMPSLVAQVRRGRSGGVRLGAALAAAMVISTPEVTVHANTTMQTFPVQSGAGPHDVYPAPDGAVWFTAQSAGKLGRLDPRTGKSDLISLGPGAAPHGVIVGPDGAAWITEGGQNAIVRVDPATHAAKLFPRSGATPTSTQPASIVRKCSGSPGRTVFTAGSIPRQVR